MVASKWGQVPHVRQTTYLSKINLESKLLSDAMSQCQILAGVLPLGADDNGKPLYSLVTMQIGYLSDFK